MKKTLVTLFMLFYAIAAAAAPGPEALIKDTSTRVIDEIKKNASVYENNPQEIYRLVDELVLPHFDFGAMTDLALGRYKDEVGEDQKPTIVNEFRTLLVRTYSSALLEYTDQELIFLPMEGNEANGKVTVRIEIEQQGGFPIPINYTLHRVGDAWKVYDISVDEVSLVTNYRSSFARKIKQSGVDGLIDSLRNSNGASVGKGS